MLPLVRRRAAPAWVNNMRMAASAASSPSNTGQDLRAEDLQGSCRLAGVHTASANTPSFAPRTFASAPLHEQQQGKQAGHQHAEEHGPHSAAREGGASTSGREDAEQMPLPNHDVYYAGPLSKTHKLLKVSGVPRRCILCSCALSLQQQ